MTLDPTQPERAMGAVNPAEAAASPLRAPDELAPFEIFNQAAAAPLLLLCDHASAFVPRALANLGLSEAVLRRHIAWDIGIAEVVRSLAQTLDAPAVLSGFSRLIIDPNRALDDPTLMTQLSDGEIVAGSRALSKAAIAARIDSFHRPYHEAIARVLDTLLKRHPAPAVISLHSFTPVMGRIERPWKIGILWNKDPRLPVALMAGLRARGVVVGDNEPYSGRDGHGYTLQRHAEPRGLANVLIEIRQDLIDTHHGAAAWSKILTEVLGRVLSDPEIYRSASSG